MFINKILSALMFVLALTSTRAQQIKFEFEEAPVNSGFRMDGYWVWGGSLIKADSTYHLFASRWPKKSEFPDGYRQHSEIVRATSANPMGPFKFEEVIIGERDSSFWDSNMAHNPTIHKIDSMYILFYIGSDFKTKPEGSNQLLRRVGYAHSKSVYGPWERAAEPLIADESNNPAYLTDGERALLVFRDEKLQTYIATANTHEGPFTILNDNLWPDGMIEDFYLFKSSEGFHILCEDNTGSISGNIRWGVNLFSKDGIKWWKYPNLIAYDHTIHFENDSAFHCKRRERPQLFIEDNKITHLFTSVLGETESWCQPVKLKQPIPLK